MKFCCKMTRRMTICLKSYQVATVSEVLRTKLLQTTFAKARAGDWKKCCKNHLFYFTLFYVTFAEGITFRWPATQIRFHDFRRCINLYARTYMYDLWRRPLVHTACTNDRPLSRIFLNSAGWTNFSADIQISRILCGNYKIRLKIRLNSINLADKPDIQNEAIQHINLKFLTWY